MNITVIGTGYLGLVTGACLSDVGIEVTCVDIDQKKIDGLKNGHTMRILEAVETVNDDQKSALFSKINTYFGGDLQSKTVAFWGLSFKQNKDGMREAPSIVLANLLTQAGAHVRAYDPVAMEEAKHDLGDTITYCESDMDAVQGVDALALITQWTEFRVPNREKVGAAMKSKVVVDGRNLYRSEIVAEAWFDYYGIGSYV